MSVNKQRIVKIVYLRIQAFKKAFRAYYANRYVLSLDDTKTT